MQPVYAGEWKDYSELPYGVDNPPEASIVFAAYDVDGYEGSAIIVFEKDGELWENHDSHCSCNGLENWSPEKSEAAALARYHSWTGLDEAVAAWQAEKIAV